jgi:hypothetical protein
LSNAWSISPPRSCRLLRSIGALLTFFGRFSQFVVDALMVETTVIGNNEEVL